MYTPVEAVLKGKQGKERGKVLYFPDACIEFDPEEARSMGQQLIEAADKAEQLELRAERKRERAQRTTEDAGYIGSPCEESRLPLAETLEHFKKGVI
jgi:hypothetical protein